jgi:hypothetical protein
MKADTITIDQLAFMTGHWRGMADDDPIEECWSTPGGGVMTAFFRWLKDDAVYLYEFQAIEPEADSLVLRIKHFNPGLVGWEEKDQCTEFSLEWIQDSEVAFRQRNTENFRRLIYRRVEDDALWTIMQMTLDGDQRTEFRYTRVND